MARRTGAWRLTPLTARSTRGVRASFVTSLPSSSTVSRRPSWSGCGRSTVIATSFASRPSASPSSGEMPALQRRQRQRAIHEPGVDEGGVDSLRQRIPDGALAGARRPVDGRRRSPSPAWPAVPARAAVPVPGRPGVAPRLPVERPPLPKAQAAMRRTVPGGRGPAAGPAAQRPRRGAAPRACAPRRPARAANRRASPGSRAHFRGWRRGAGGEQARRPSSSGTPSSSATSSSGRGTRSSSTAYSRSIA